MNDLWIDDKGTGDGDDRLKRITELPPEVQRLILTRKRDRDRPRTYLDMLGEKHMMELIVYVDRRSPVMKSDVYENVSKSSSIPVKISELEALGIVNVYQIAKNNSNVLMITPKGRRIARLINDILDEMDSV